MGLFSRKIKDKKEEPADQKTAQVQAVAGNEKPKSMKELYEEGQVKSALSTRAEKKEKLGEEETRRKFGQAYRVLLKPLVTEKATNLGVFNKYVFAVAPETNKIEVAKAVEEIYGIKPVGVNIIKMKGKSVRRGRTSGKRKNWKKAIVALPAGKTIKVYEGV